MTRAVEAAGAYPTAVTITVYAPAVRAPSVRTAPSSSAAARSTWAPVMSVTVTTACWHVAPREAHPYLPRALAPRRNVGVT
ncbi:hypothetical protein SBADM41S_03022 [Streptomyces badius]